MTPQQCRWCGGPLLRSMVLTEIAEGVYMHTVCWQRMQPSDRESELWFWAWWRKRHPEAPPHIARGGAQKRPVGGE